MLFRTIKLLFICLLFNCNIAAQNAHVLDSLTTVLRKLDVKTGFTADTTRVNTLMELSRNWIQANPDSAISYGNKAIAIAEKIHYTDGAARGMHLTSNAFLYKGDYKTALDHAKKGLQLFQELKNKKYIIRSLNTISQVYYYQGDFSKDLEYAMRSLKMEEEQGNKKGMAYCYNVIGVVYDEQNNYPKALEYYFKSAEMFESSDKPYGANAAYNNIGMAYRKTKNYTEALKYDLKALKMQEEKNDKVNITFSLNNIGTLYFEIGDEEKSVEYDLKALKLREELGDKNGIASSYINIAQTYARQGGLIDPGNKPVSEKEGASAKRVIQPASLNKAIDFINKGLKIGKEIGAQEVLKEGYKTLSDIYVLLGQYGKAYEYLKLHKTANDTMFNQENSKKIAELNIQYETEKKDNSIKQLEQNKEISELKAQEESHKHAIQLGLLSGILILSAGGSLYWYNRNKAKNRELHLQAALQAEEIKRKQIEAELKLQQEKERISRDLHDSVGSQLTYIISQLDYTSAIADGNEGVQAKINNLGDNARELMQMLREIIWAIQKEELSLSDFSFKIRELLARYQSSFPAINFTYEFDETSADKEALNPNQLLNLFRIIQEAITNSIKHARANNISVELNVMQQGLLQLSITDDGAGMADIAAKAGHYGLGNMKTRAEEMQGQFSISSDPAKGTKITVELKMA